MFTLKVTNTYVVLNLLYLILFYSISLGFMKDKQKVFLHCNALINKLNVRIFLIVFGLLLLCNEQIIIGPKQNSDQKRGLN